MPSMVHDLFGCVIIQSWPFNLSYLAITILVLTDLDTLYLFNLAFEQFSCNNISVLLTFTLSIPLFSPCCPPWKCGIFLQVTQTLVLHMLGDIFLLFSVKLTFSLTSLMP
jgi:hypothetical protein